MNLLEGFKAFGILIKNISGFVFKPFRFIGKAFFNHGLVPLYQLYRKIKKIGLNIFDPFRRSFLYPLVSKHIAITVLAAVGLLVAYNNIDLRTAEAQQIGTQSIAAAINYNLNADIEEVVEGVPPLEEHLFASIITPVQATPLPTVTTTAQERTTNVVVASGGAGTIEKPTGVTSYTVQGGDTISTIADQFEISTQTVLWANGLGETDYIKPGQTLKIPPVSGVIHNVQSGDTVSSIAKKYGVSDSTILDYNKLADASIIESGQVLVVPGGKPPETPKPVSTSVAKNSSSYSGSIPSSAPASNVRFIWPTTSHRINQYYRYGHTGVDIDGDYSSPMYAAAAGVVSKVAYLNYGYGYHVIITHSDGTQTVYAHASKIFVTQGQHVSQGQTIAMVGTTGRSTGTHLHFEIIIGGHKINPLSYIR
ncbi:MAG: M23 family metallopeptidase [Patescibacteria group bacterium]